MKWVLGQLRLWCTGVLNVVGTGALEVVGHWGTDGSEALERSTGTSWIMVHCETEGNTVVCVIIFYPFIL